MDINKILENMPKESREILQLVIKNYLSTKELRYAEEAIKILRNFEEEVTVKDLDKSLERY